MSLDDIVVEQRNAEQGQAAFQVAVDEDGCKWYRCELRDGHVVFIQEYASAFPWADHQPPLDLPWTPVELPVRVEERP